MSKISNTTLGELVEFQRGYDLPKSQFIEGKIPVISSNGILGYHNLSKVKGPGITIGRSGTVGLPHFINEDFFPHNTALFIKDFKGNYRRYIYYLIKTLGLNDYKSGSGVPTMNRNHLHPIKVRAFLDFEEQKKIAKVLSDIDAKIEINNRINSELEAMAKTLYDYWFVQFDFPNVSSSGVEKPYKSSGGKMVWNAELKREIPEGWEVGTLNSIGNIIGGSTPSKAIDENFCFGEGTPWITPKDLSNNKGKKYITRGEYDVTERGLKEASLKIMPEGTVLLSSRAPIGYLAIARTDVTTNQGFKSFVPKNNFSSEYIYFTIQNCIPEIEANSSGSTFKEVSSSTLKTIKTILPIDEILLAFDILIKPIFSKQDCVELENQELASLRDWLLPMLMNGQVSVGEVKEELGMVAEPIEIYQKTEKKIIEKVKKVKIIAIKLNPVDVYKRTLLAAEIVFQLKDTYTLGHLKLQKMLYLCQEIENMTLPMKFLKQAMGPYDNQLARSLDKQFIEKKWFMYQKNESLKYKPLENCGKHRNDFNKYFEEQVEGINYLIKKFSKFTSNQIEAVATLYACWKEAIDNNELINDKLIISSFYKWSKEKEKFKEENLVKALDWMRKNGVEPKSQID